MLQLPFDRRVAATGTLISDPGTTVWKRAVREIGHFLSDHHAALQHGSSGVDGGEQAFAKLAP
jgi:hypothetical protein